MSASVLDWGGEKENDRLGLRYAYVITSNKVCAALHLNTLIHFVAPNGLFYILQGKLYLFNACVVIKAVDIIMFRPVLIETGTDRAAINLFLHKLYHLCQSLNKESILKENSSNDV